MDLGTVTNRFLKSDKKFQIFFSWVQFAWVDGNLKYYGILDSSAHPVLNRVEVPADKVLVDRITGLTISMVQKATTSFQQ